MSSCLIVQVQVNDVSSMPDHAAQVHDFVHRYNEKYVARSTNQRAIESTVAAGITL